MIIAFYPGAGGNRYQRMMQNLVWQQSNISYDAINPGQDFKNRYLLSESVNTDRDFILTHCLNKTHLQNKIPGHNIIFIIGDLKACLQREWLLAGHNLYIKKQTDQILHRLEHYNAIKDAAWPVCISHDELDNLPRHILQEVDQDYKKIVKRQQPAGDILRMLETAAINKVNSSYEIIKWHKEYYSTYPVEFSSKDTVIDISTGTEDFSITMQYELNLYSSEIFDLAWSKLHEQR
jgi:hypothetical protein